MPCSINGVIDAPLDVGFYADKVANPQALASGAALPITYDAERDDHGNDFSLVTGLFTAPRAGWYVFALSNGITMAAGGRTEMTLFSSVHGNVATGSDTTGVAGTVFPDISVCLYMDQGETLEARAFQNSGLGATISTAGSSFTGVQISEV